MLNIKVQCHGPIGSREDAFKGFYHVAAWQPCWSCDLDHLNIFMLVCDLDHLNIFLLSQPLVTGGPVAFEEMFKTVILRVLD